MRLEVVTVGGQWPDWPMTVYRSISEESKMTTESKAPQGKSLADEVYREYKFASGQVYRIDAPKALFVGKTSHRVLDSDGMVHIVVFPGPSADTVLTYKPRDPNNPVAF